LTKSQAALTFFGMDFSVKFAKSRFVCEPTETTLKVHGDISVRNISIAVFT
jgi:hypothetical protein